MTDDDVNISRSDDPMHVRMMDSTNKSIQDLSRNCHRHVATCHDDMSFVANFWPTWVTCESHD